MIDATAAQGFVQFARTVGGEDYHRPLVSTDSAAFRNGNLKVRQKFQKEGFKLVIRAVDFVDQQHGLLRTTQTGQHRPLDQKFVAVDIDIAAGAFALTAQRQHLAGKIPFVERGGSVDALVALQAQQRAAEHAGNRLGGFGLADTRRAFQQQRFAQRQREIGGGRKLIVRQIIGGPQSLFELARTADPDNGVAHRHEVLPRARRL